MMLAGLPSWSTGTLTAEYRNPSTGELIPGTVTVALPVRLTNSADDATIPKGIVHNRVPLATTGDKSFSVTVPSTDDPDIEQVGWGYTVTVSLSGFDGEEFTGVPVPTGGVTNLRTIIPSRTTLAPPPSLNLGPFIRRSADGDLVDGSGNPVAVDASASWETLEGIPQVIAAGDDEAQARDAIGALSAAWRPNWDDIQIKPELGYDVTMAGAKGDEATFDSTPFIQAVRAFTKNLYFPPGVFNVRPLTLGPRESWRGAGVGLTTLKLWGGTNGSLVSMVDAHRSLLTDMTLDGNRANNISTTADKSVLKIYATPGNLDSSYYLTVDRVVVVNGAANGVTLPGNTGETSYNWVLQLSNVAVKFCSRYGFYDETSDNRFSNFYFTENDMADMYLKGASSNLYVNFKVGEGGLVHNTDHPTKTDGACMILENVIRCTFTNFDIQSSFWDGVYAKDCRYLIFNGVDSQNNDNWGFRFYNCAGITGTVSTAPTSGYSNTAGDFFIDPACSNIDLQCPPTSVGAGAPQVVIANQGINCRIRTKEEPKFGTITNVAPNGNFTTGANWQASGKTLASETLTWRATYSGDAAYGYFTGAADAVYYVRVLVKADSPDVALYLFAKSGTAFHVKNHTGSGNYEVLSGVKSIRSPITTPALMVNDQRASGWTDISLRYAVCINLTEAFGPGYEPSVEEMDALVGALPSGWFGGSLSLQATRYTPKDTETVLRGRSRKAAAAPTTGTGKAGEIVWNSAPAAGGTVGWVCVADGTPGTWKPFGTIAA